MGLNTRSRKREIICSACSEFSIDNSVDKSFKLNIPEDSVGPDAKKMIKATLLDISVLGCALDSPYLIPPGVLVHVRIDPLPFTAETGIDRKEPLKALGRVRSCVMKSAGHYRLGIEFKNTEKEDMDFIDTFVSSKERRKAGRWKIR